MPTIEPNDQITRKLTKETQNMTHNENVALHTTPLPRRRPPCSGVGCNSTCSCVCVSYVVPDVVHFVRTTRAAGQEGWRKLRAEMDLLKGEEDVRDKDDAIKPIRRLLDINESDDESDGERAMDELTRF